MKMSYQINGVFTTKSLTEWYIGASTLKRLTNVTLNGFKSSGMMESKFWVKGTGWLTIIID